MYCLRCGREAEGEQVFCSACRENMEQYPVKPGTPIHLPHRQIATGTKKRLRRKRQLLPEEQVLHLKKSLRRTRVFVALLILLLGLAIGAGYWYFSQIDTDIGRNYTIDTNQQTE